MPQPRLANKLESDWKVGAAKAMHEFLVLHYFAADSVKWRVLALNMHEGFTNSGRSRQPAQWMSTRGA